MISFVKPIDYHEKIKMVATALMMVAACLISFSPDLAANSALTFSLFFLVHIIWASYALVWREMSLLWMNIGLIPLDIYAIGIRI